MREALRRPASGTVEAWLSAVANRLLNRVRLVAGGEAHRLVEVEAYYHSTDHPDAFAHCDPIQLEQGRWYFHKTRGTYRSGSFKGLDISFGDGKAHGGFLFRGLEQADGTLIDGPSLLVDHLLEKAGKLDIYSLDVAINARPAWDTDSPLHLVEVADEGRPIFTSARVGLSLKKLKPTADNARYLLKNYRFLSEPGRTAKGKVLLVLALHKQGKTPEQIRALTGCPIGTVKRYVEDYELGTKESDLSVYGGVDLGPKELCRLHGFGLK
jgi:hypothetical protein